jgi:MFS family permease
VRMSDALRWPRATARATAGASRTAARATRRAGSAVRHRGDATARFIHRVTGASGAGGTGLGTLVELTAAASVADAFIAVSLAGTIFFSSSVTEARGKVALFLLVTMAPFALLAPVIGPALDRMQQGRKYLLAATLVARGLLCWGMSAAINNPVTLLPAAFGILVLQKCYGVVRASIAPRLLPAEMTLVKANARSALITLVASSIAAPTAAGIAWAAGDAWLLRAATIVYLLSVVLALRLPSHVDVPAPAAADLAAPASAAGSAWPAYEPDEGDLPDYPGFPGPGYPDYPGYPGYAEDDNPSQNVPPPATGPNRTLPLDAPAGATGGASAGATAQSRGPRLKALQTLGSLGPAVADAMRANAVLRALSGYMIFFLAFLLRTENFAGVSHNVALGAMVAAAAAGALLAMGIGSAVGSRAPATLMYTMMAVATVATAVCAWFFGFGTAIAVAFVAALCTGLAKLAQDSIVQREISEEVRSSAFAVSETLHQLSWVVGGLAGLLVSMLDNGQAGLGITAGCLAVAFAYLVVQRRRRVRARRKSAAARRTSRSTA